MKLKCFSHKLEKPLFWFFFVSDIVNLIDGMSSFVSMEYTAKYVTVILENNQSSFQTVSDFYSYGS